jgi:hypothetical protein
VSALYMLINNGLILGATSGSRSGSATSSTANKCRTRLSS